MQYKLGSFFAEVLASIAEKFPTPSGTTSQYVRGDGSLATFPATMTPSSHSHAISDIAGLQTAIDNLWTAVNGKQAAGSYAAASHTHAASDVTDLTAALSKLAALKVNKMEVFSTTTDGNGDFTVTTGSTFANPIVVACVSATGGAEGYHAHVTSISSAVVNGRAFKNKTQGVLIGGTIDPDSAVASNTAIYVIVADKEV